MRKPVLMGLAAAVIGAVLASTTTPADAGFRRHPAGWGTVRTVTHYGYYPRYHHVYRTHSATDPYAYRYQPRGYYPYYNSGYWKSAREMRCRKKHRHYGHPPYYQSWGYPDRQYRHRAWHARHHCYIRRDHW